MYGKHVSVLFNKGDYLLGRTLSDAACPVDNVVILVPYFKKSQIYNNLLWCLVIDCSFRKYLLHACVPGIFLRCWVFTKEWEPYIPVQMELSFQWMKHTANNVYSLVMTDMKEMKAGQFPSMSPLWWLFSFSGKFIFCIRSSCCGIAIANRKPAATVVAFLHPFPARNPYISFLLLCNILPQT